MRLHITPGDGNPIYRQIMNQIQYLVASKRLQPGDELPPIRTLAQQLLINPNTVARAYRELETMGLLSSRQGSGTVVADHGSPFTEKEKVRIVTERIDALLAEASHLDMPVDVLVEILRKRHRDMQKA